MATFIDYGGREHDALKHARDSATYRLRQRLPRGRCQQRRRNGLGAAWLAYRLTPHVPRRGGCPGE